jgi:hypothetical protein
MVEMIHEGHPVLLDVFCISFRKTSLRAVNGSSSLRYRQNMDLRTTIMVRTSSRCSVRGRVLVMALNIFQFCSPLCAGVMDSVRAFQQHCGTIPEIEEGLGKLKDLYSQ